jgi:dihydrolipoamide dehydrogenase
MSEKYDLIVIGGGPGGHAAAEHAAHGKARVAIIEKNLWGGTCTHRGCIPTKALLACSRQYVNLKGLKRLGIHTGETSVDFTAVRRHQRQMISISTLGVQKSLKDAGAEMKTGVGRIISPREVELTSAEEYTIRLSTDNIVIAWGSEPHIPPHIKISQHILTSDGFLTMETLPQSVIIIGGSAIGVEFATFLAEMGVKTTILEILDRLVPQEDEEASDALTRELARLGIDVHTSAQLKSLSETSQGVHLEAVKNAKRIELTADYALICTGRKPVLYADELNSCGITFNEKGISVNKSLMTGTEGVYAIGDATGGAMSAHRAIHQGRSVVSHLFGDRSFMFNEEVIPSVIYTHPNVARVGLTEKQALEKGLKTEIRRTDYATNIMARTYLKGTGFVKAIFCEGKLIGVTIVGDDAGELIASMSLAVAHSMGVKELNRWVIPHPTLSEILRSL